MTNKRIVYEFEECPYCEKTRRTLDWVGMDYERFHVDPGDRSEVLEVSGQELVPVLVDGEDVVPDSTRIFEYLDEEYDLTVDLIPVDPSIRAQAYILNRYAEDVWGSLGYRAQKSIDKNGNSLSAEGAEELQNEIDQAATLLDDYFTGCGFAVGDSMTMADISLSSFVSRILECSDYSISERHQDLWTWYNRVEETIHEPAAA